MAEVEFRVVAESLMRAAVDIRVVAAAVRDGSVDGFDNGLNTGHARLQVVLSDYCARWNQGLKVAIHGQEHIADSLDVAVAGYLAQDEQSAATFRDIQRDLSPR